MKILDPVHAFIRSHIATLEMIGVLMRIFSFTLVSWLGPASPFLFVWIVNTVDAVLLSWCSILKKDRAYTLLNIFWIVVGLVGIYRASGAFHENDAIG
jgi:phosphoglycerol transferase MdoB-like AlkP superfamily enzyme